MKRAFPKRRVGAFTVAKICCTYQNHVHPCSPPKEASKFATFSKLLGNPIRGYPLVSLDIPMEDPQKRRSTPNAQHTLICGSSYAKHPPNIAN